MRRVLFSVLTVGCVALAVLANAATAGEPLDFHCSGSGVFSPTNIGTNLGGNAGIVIGDGSGLSQYEASGDNFTIGGQLVGDGTETHTGEAVSRTTGIFKEEQGIVRWPAKSGVNHVLSSDDGDIEFRHMGGFTLDLAAFAAGEPSFTGDAIFIIVGGTDRFEGASGIVWVDVAASDPLTALPPPGVSPSVPFDYDFNGFIVLGE